MSKSINILLLSLLCLTCKKKTTTTVLVYNYALAEPIANAKVVLVEKKGEGSDASCNIITSSTTDADGKCVFDQEKLRTSSNYSYYCAISEAYNTPQNYPCAGKTSGYLDVGKPNSQMLNVSIFGAYLKVQYNNLLNPSQSGDSINIVIACPKYNVPNDPDPFGGGGVFYSGFEYGCNGYPFNSICLTSAQKTYAGKNVMYTRKRKMGIVTTSVDTIKIYPYETKIIDVNW